MQNTVNEEEKKPYDLKARSIGITLQCGWLKDFSEEQIKDWIDDVTRHYKEYFQENIKKLVFSHEIGKNGHHHIQGFVEFRERLYLANARERLGYKHTFSDNPKENPMTPNFSNPVKYGDIHHARSVLYCFKEGRYINHNYSKTELRDFHKTTKKKDITWFERNDFQYDNFYKIINNPKENTDPPEEEEEKVDRGFLKKTTAIVNAFKAVEEGKSIKEAVVEAMDQCALLTVETNRLTAGLAMKYTKPEKPRYQIEDYTVPDVIMKWFTTGDLRTLMVVGETGIGKTKMIQALVQDYVTVSLDESFKDLNEQKYIIIDDYQSYSKLERREHWISLVDCDDDRRLNVKHTSAFIRRGTRKVITSNETLDLICPFKENGSVDKAIRRRVLEVIIPKGMRLLKPEIARSDKDTSESPQSQPIQYPNQEIYETDLDEFNSNNKGQRNPIFSTESSTQREINRANDSIIQPEGDLIEQCLAKINVLHEDKRKLLIENQELDKLIEKQEEYIKILETNIPADIIINRDN